MALTTPFARNGNRKAVPQTAQDGSVNYNEGFGAFYALPPEEGGLFIDRAQFNQILYDTTSAVISNQNSINTLNGKVTANQNSINTLNSSVNTLNTKVANIESGAATGVVNLTTNQIINGIKTFSVPPVSATNPANANQIANKAYVDTIASTKANFITASVKIGASEKIKNLNEFKIFAQNNFAHYYRISITSNIEETNALTLQGLNIGFSTTEYTITFKQSADFHYCKVFFGKIGLKIDSQTSARITFLLSEVYVNGNVTFTDLVPASVVNTEQPSAILLYGSRFSTGGDDDWNITSTARNFIGITHSYLGLINITFTGSLASGKTLFNFELQGILMTQSCEFNNLSVTSIAQNQLSNKGIWFNV